MKIHRNAKTTPAARAALVHRALQERWTNAATAAAFAVSERTVAKWVQRYRAGGCAALEDASSRPGPAPHQTPARVVSRIKQLRVERGLPAWAIARAVGRPRSTVSAWGLGAPWCERSRNVSTYGGHHHDPAGLGETQVGDCGLDIADLSREPVIGGVDDL